MEDLTGLEERLDRAQTHVERGLRHLARQTSLIAEGRARGKDVTQLWEMLATLEETQRLHVWDRDRLRRDLDAASAGKTWLWTI